MDVLDELQRKKRVFLAFFRTLRITLRCYDYSSRRIWRHSRGFKWMIQFLMYLILNPEPTDSSRQPAQKPSAGPDKRREKTNT